MHFKHLEILPFKTYDSLVLSIFAVCCPQSSLSSECSQHSRKKPHTHWLAARAHLPWPWPGEPRLHCLFLWSGLSQGQFLVAAFHFCSVYRRAANQEARSGQIPGPGYIGNMHKIITTSCLQRTVLIV